VQEVPWEQLVRRESKDPLELLVSRVCPVPPDLWVRLASLETEESQESRDLLDLLESRESVVTLVLPEPLVLRAPWDPADLLEPPALMVARESQVLPVLLVPLDTKAQVACPVSVVPLEPPDPRERRERLDTEDWRVTLEEMVLVVHPDQVDPPDHLVPMATRVRVVLSDLLAQLDLVGLLVSVEKLDQLVLPDSPDPLVLTARQEPEESVAPLEEREMLEPLDPLAPPGSLDPLAQPEPLDPLVLAVTPAPLV